MRGTANEPPPLGRLRRANSPRGALSTQIPQQILSLKGMTMKLTTALLIASFAAAPAFASEQAAPLTREQVRAETLQAMRDGTMLSAGEASLPMRKINPRAYPPAPAPTASKSRDQVLRELNQAIQSGEMLAAGESGIKLNEVAPGQYPTQRLVAGPSKTRDQVKEELAQAIAKGEVAVNGEDGRMLKEVFPGLYRDTQDVAAERSFKGGGSQGM